MTGNGHVCKFYAGSIILQRRRALQKVASLMPNETQHAGSVDWCNCTVDINISTGNLSVMLPLLYICGQVHMQLH